MNFIDRQRRYQEEIERRKNAVLRCKIQATEAGRLAPTQEQLTEALGDQIGGYGSHRTRPPRGRYRTRKTG